MKDDDAWKYCKGKWIKGISSNRERAIRAFELSDRYAERQRELVIARIKNHQRGVHFKKNNQDAEWNYFVKVLGVEGLKNLAMNICDEYCCRRHEKVSWNLQGNTLSVLYNLVQQNIYHLLYQGIHLAVYRTKSSNEYPILIKDDIDFIIEVCDVGGRIALTKQHQSEKKKKDDAKKFKDFVTKLENIVTPENQEKIVDHIAKLAGVVTLNIDAIETVWTEIIKIMIVLLSSACTELGSASRSPKFMDYAEYSRDEVDLFQDLVPVWYDEDNVKIITIVPSLIERAAKRVNLRYTRVYGSGWLVCEGTTKEKEMEVAKNQYFSKEDNSCCAIKDSDEESAVESMSISSDKDSYSVYSDTE